MRNDQIISEHVTSDQVSTPELQEPLRTASQVLPARKILLVRLTKSPLLTAVLVGFGLWLLVQLINQALWVLMVVLLAIILAAAMMPIVEIIRRFQLPRVGWRLPYGGAVALIYLVLAVTLGLLIYFAGRVLVADISNLLATLPQLTETGLRWLNELEERLGLPMSLTSSPEETNGPTSVLSGAFEGVRFAGVFANSLIAFGFQLSLVLTLALFMVVESDRIMTFWVTLFAPSQREKARDVTVAMGKKMSFWLLGQIGVATISGTLAGLGAWALGLPYPLLIGLVTALVDLAPVLGVTLMTIPAFFLGLSQSLTLGLVAAAFFYVLAQIEANFMAPMITGRSVQLSPTLVLIAVPLGLAFYGAIGALIAIPVTAALQVFANEVLLPWLRERQGIAEQKARAASN